MRAIGSFGSIAGLGMLVALSVTYRVDGAAARDGAFRPPEPGVRMKFDNGRAIVVLESSGLEYRLLQCDEAGQAALEMDVVLAFNLARVTDLKQNRAARFEFDEGALASLWPLRVGKSATYAAARVSGSERTPHTMSITVSDRTSKRVPAGEFHVFVVDVVQDFPDMRGAHVVNRFRYWFDTSLGGYVARLSKFERDGETLAENLMELVSMTTGATGCEPEE